MNSNTTRRTTRLLAGLALSLASITAVAGTASAAPGNPHAEQQDGCDHGATGKKCRPDPQADRGKDCLAHGKWGGINEDHCARPGGTN